MKHLSLLTLIITALSLVACKQRTIENRPQTTDSAEAMSLDYAQGFQVRTLENGHLVLQTTKSSWTYSGSVDADEVNNAAVTVGKNVTWNGAIDSDHNAISTKVTIEKGSVWNLTADSYVSSLENNGRINKNGYTLTVGSQSGE